MSKFKTIFINIFLLFIFVIIIELIFGYWFKNKFNLKLSAERNIERIYKFNFDLHKGSSLYKRNNHAFRIGKKNIKPKNIDIVFSGGSTTNQKFLNYDDTIVGIIDKKFVSKNIVNAGIDGMSIIGHLNSFENWFDKIKNLNPDYYIFFIGINDNFVLKIDPDDTKPREIDYLLENSFKENFINYLKSNSFFYIKLRKIRSNLYFKFEKNKFANIVNENARVYGERENKRFRKYEDYNSNQLNAEIINVNYLNRIEELTNKVLQRNAKVIYITQISGTGMDRNLYIISHTIMKHCKDNKIKCINLAKNADLVYEDFYDWTHLNKKGSLKAANYIISELSDILPNS